MDLVDMKLPKRSKAEMEKEGLICTSSPGMPEQDKWPYGLQLRFEKEQIDKIPSLVDYKVGDKVLITAEARVTEVRMVEKQGGEDRHSVELQIEKISCESKKPLEKMNMREYREARQSGK